MALSFSAAHDAVDNKIKELLMKESELMNSNVAESTKHTQGYQIRRTVKHLQVIRALLKIINTQVNDNIYQFVDEKTFLSITEPSEKRNLMSVEVNKGDRVMDLLSKYQVPNIMEKLQKRAAQKGLKINFATGMVE